MIIRPPVIPRRLLGWALRGHSAARAILGDLLEDYVRMARDHGGANARRWYWREALLLAAGVGPRRLLPSFSTPPRSGAPESAMTLTGLAHDLRYAYRAVRQDPGFLILGVLIIGLGVGASTAVFSVIDPLLLRPLPFAEPERLVWVANTGGGGGMSAVTSRTRNLRDFRAMAGSFDGLTGYDAFFEQNGYNLVGASGEPERLAGVRVAQDFLDVLGIEPLVGRNFDAEEGVWDGRPAVILTHSFWEQRFGADPAIVGTSISLNEIPREVVGVLPAWFDFSSVFTPAARVDILLPWPISDETDRWGNTTSIIGRLRPGASVDGAQAELDGILAALEEADPERWGLGAAVSPLQSEIAGPYRSAMLLLAAAAGAVILIVCVNLSNMLLAKGPRRAREMALRRSLGATSRRVVRQLLLESLMLAAGGAAVGIAIAFAVTRLVASTSAISIPMLYTVAIDTTALLFSLSIAVVAGLTVGVLPAIHVIEGGDAGALRAGSRTATQSRRSTRLREGLVVAQLALAFVLLVCGGLLLRSFQRVLDVDLGFQAADVVTWELNTSQQFDGLADMIAFYASITRSSEEIPGVESVGLTDAGPLGRNRTWGVRREEAEGEDPDDFIAMFPHIVDPGYIPTMKIPLISGRQFTRDDTLETDPVVIINETAARVLYPGQSPVLRSVMLGNRPWRVVGVVGDVRHDTLESESGVEVYLPIAQSGDFSSLELVVRASLPQAELVRRVRENLRAHDAGMPTEGFTSLTAVVDHAASPRRFILILVAAFAAAALLLAALGIYGVLSYAVTERTPEIRIRMALGEAPDSVRRRVIVRTVALAATGIALGAVGAFAASRLMSSLLFAVAPTDPLTFAGMGATLLAVATLAGVIPAFRASRTDAAGALQSS